MDLNKSDGKLHVNYSDRLVTLLREVRQLTSLGFTVPAKIQHVAATAQRFYRHGVILKQVKSPGYCSLQHSSCTCTLLSNDIVGFYMC